MQQQYEKHFSAFESLYNMLMSETRRESRESASLAAREVQASQ
jgi:hypothetical protein